MVGCRLQSTRAVFNITGGIYASTTPQFHHHGAGTKAAPAHPAGAASKPRTSAIVYFKSGLFATKYDTPIA
jgi:hypothetical protein